MQGYLEVGANLTNINNALSFGNNQRIAKSVDKIDAFFVDLFSR